jgi:amino-acid N-acetyltransferase
MEFGRVGSEHLTDVVALLEQCELPAQDVDGSLLRYFVGARDHGRLVGVVGLQPLPGAALLRSLAVVPDHRGLGIGERLCDEAESLARAGDMHDIYALTTTAVDYFAQRGYVRVARHDLPEAIRGTQQFRTLCPDSAVALHKRLTRSAAGAVSTQP